MDAISFEDYFTFSNVIDDNIWSSVNDDIQDFNTCAPEGDNTITCDTELYAQTIPLLDPSHAYPTPDLTPAAEYPQTSHQVSFEVSDIEKYFCLDAPQPIFLPSPDEASHVCQWNPNHGLLHEFIMDPPPPALSAFTCSTEDATSTETANAQISEDDCFPTLHASSSAISQTLFEDVIDFQTLTDLLQSGPQDFLSLFLPPNLSQTDFDQHTPMEPQAPLSPSTYNLLSSLYDYGCLSDTSFRFTETSDDPHTPSGVAEPFSGAVHGSFSPDTSSSGSAGESPEVIFSPVTQDLFTYPYSVSTPDTDKLSPSASEHSPDYNIVSSSSTSTSVSSSPDRSQASTLEVAGPAVSSFPIPILQRSRVPKHTSELELLRRLYSSAEFQRRLPGVPILEGGLADPEVVQDIEGRKSHKGHSWRFTLLSHDKSKLESPKQLVFFVCINPRQPDCFYVCSESSTMNHHQYRNDHTAARNVCLCGKAFGRSDSLSRHLKRKNSEFHQLVED